MTNLRALFSRFVRSCFFDVCVIGKRGDSWMREEGGRSLSRVEVKSRILPIMSFEKLGVNKNSLYQILLCNNSVDIVGMRLLHTFNIFDLFRDSKF